VAYRRSGPLVCTEEEGIRREELRQPHVHVITLCPLQDGCDRRSVKAGRTGNGAWGRSMLARRGGKAMAIHCPHILAENRRRLQAQRQFAQTWKRRQSHPRTSADWQQTLVVWPQQERMPRDFIAW
jgi:hypothetical protein